MDAAGEQRVNSVLPRFELNNVASRFQHILAMFRRNGVTSGQLPGTGNGIDGDDTASSVIIWLPDADEVGRSRFGIPIRWSNHCSANFFGSFGTTTDFFVAFGLCREAVSAYKGTTSRRQSAVKRKRSSVMSAISDQVPTTPNDPQYYAPRRLREKNESAPGSSGEPQSGREAGSVGRPRRGVTRRTPVWAARTARRSAGWSHAWSARSNVPQCTGISAPPPSSW